MTDLSPADQRQLEQRGISTDELERQIEFLRGPSPFVVLDRPAIPGDGIHRLSEEWQREFLEHHDVAARECRYSKFVPASGAASRMFRDLLPGNAGFASAQAQFMDQRQQFPFHDHLARIVGDASEAADWVNALLGQAGLSYGELPKALVAFHRDTGEPRTPFDEHLVEAAETIRDDGKRCRVHFTVSPEHRRLFVERLEWRGSQFESVHDCHYDVSYSEQSPATDTAAIDSAGQMLRDEAGRIVFRPGGHGALIRNLHDLSGDLVFVKNIDNVQPDNRRATTIHWKKCLGGLAAWLANRLGDDIRWLREESSDEKRLQEIGDFVRQWFFLDVPAGLEYEAHKARLLQILERPLRVAGVVQNRDEPGGGPFWVRDGDDQVRLQIVETAQIDQEDPEQLACSQRATHFNPVDLVCAVRDADRRPHDLERFVDPRMSIITQKSVHGQSARVLERPGLWNGAMAGWLTVFVEVPLETFSPVKTVFDLLRPEHQV